MKKVLIIMMVVLLIGALFISCSNEVEKDTLGKVSISFDDSRSINTSVTSSVKSVNELVWFYTATKTSGLYATGQTSSLTIVPAYDNNSTAGKLTTGTSLGNFSTGNWKFSFYGFNEAADSSDLTKAVYYSIDIPVRVEGEGQVAVRIVLSEGKVDLGKVVFDDLSIDLNAFNGLLRTGGTLSLDIFMNEETETGKVATMSGGPVTTAAVYNLTPAAEKTNLQAGTYEFIFVLNYTTDAGLETEETVEVARESKTVVIANGTIITFSGDILKTNTLKNVVIGDITEGENKAQASFVGEVPTEQTTVSVAVSPASASDTSETIANTKVTFPADMLATAVINAVEQNEVLTSSKVTIEVTSTLEATTKFEIKATSDSNAFAGINLDLWKTVTTTGTEGSTTSRIDNPTFETPVIVETYIAKGLTGVTVEYTGTGDHPIASDISDEASEKQAHVYDTDAAMGEKLGYSQQSGLLRFKTTHFSEFAVGAEQYVYDKNTNTAYKLNDAGMPVGIDNEVVTAAALHGHELVLLDSKYANDVSDDIDVFNAGYSWSVIHAADDIAFLSDLSGYGTKVEPYEIATGGDWYYLLQQYQGYYMGSGQYGLYIFLVGDIDMSQYDIDSFASYPRNIHIDGQNHKIKNLSTSIWGGDGGTLYLRNSFKDIVLENCHASNDALFSGTQNSNTAYVLFDNVDMNNCSAVGGAYQYYDGSAEAVFKNCNATNTNVVGDYMASGGFVGNISTGTILIDKCSFGGSVVSTSGSCAGFVGQPNSSPANVVITNSTILKGTNIRNIGGGSVAAFDGQSSTRNYISGTGNSFSGTLEAEANKTHSQGAETTATIKTYSPTFCTKENFVLNSANGEITYNGTTTVPKIKVQCYVIHDYIYNGNYYGGYNWYLCNPIKKDSIESDSKISGIPIITDFYNVVSSEDTPVGLKTTDTSHVDEIVDNVFYFDATTASWGHYMLGGTYDKNSGTAINPSSLNVYIRISVFDELGLPDAGFTYSYSVDLSSHQQ